MGSWGSGSFQNDPALDFVADLNESANGAPLRDELQRTIDHGGTKQPSRFGKLIGRRSDRLTIGGCQRAIAAAEIVAGLRGRPPTKLPQSATAWIAAHPDSFSEDLVAIAQAAIAIIKTDSELRDEYDPAEWQDKMEDLEMRLGNR
jgi:hypothetical protein